MELQQIVAFCSMNRGELWRFAVFCGELQLFAVNCGNIIMG
jgi:hypothetical protein